MPLLELENCTAVSREGDARLVDVTFSVNPGETVLVSSASAAEARLFFRLLATLERPGRGAFRYRGGEVDFSDKQGLLAYKRRVGYICADASLLSNRTLAENILYGRFYMENVPFEEPDPVADRLCARFGIAGVLESRPGQVHEELARAAVVVRELRKQPELLLVERPWAYFGHALYRVFMDTLRRRCRGGAAVVFSSSDEKLADGMDCRLAHIENGCLNVVGASVSATTTLDLGGVVGGEGTGR
ncbi:MAG: hypothetical protein ACLFOY_12055 [Desulfatibacillaceae bacterium]